MLSAWSCRFNTEKLISNTKLQKTQTPACLPACIDIQVATIGIGPWHALSACSLPFNSSSSYRIRLLFPTSPRSGTMHMTAARRLPINISRHKSGLRYQKLKAAIIDDVVACRKSDKHIEAASGMPGPGGSMQTRGANASHILDRDRPSGLLSPTMPHLLLSFLPSNSNSSPSHNLTPCKANTFLSVSHSLIIHTIPSFHITQPFISCFNCSLSPAGLCSI